MIGYNRTETTLFLAGDREAFQLDEDGLRRRAALLFRDQSEKLIDEFRAANPGATPSDLFFLIGSESMMGALSRKIAQRKSEQGRAPAYLYRFDWETPVAHGRLRSPHALEITFVFDHAGEPLAPRLAPDSPEVRRLAAEMSSRWIAFARTGNPNIANGLHWPPYSVGERATMIFNSKCRVENDPSRQERIAIDRVLFSSETP
jgi:para-nitrobenzyl esterase